MKHTGVKGTSIGLLMGIRERISGCYLVLLLALTGHDLEAVV